MLTARCRTSKVDHGCDVCSPTEKKPSKCIILCAPKHFYERESLGMRLTCILHNFHIFLFCHVVDIYVELMFFVFGAFDNLKLNTDHNIHKIRNYTEKNISNFVKVWNLVSFTIFYIFFLYNFDSIFPKKEW